MLLYSLRIYKWTINLLNKLYFCIKFFVWIGSVDIKKLITTYWKVICSPLFEGDLGLREIKTINKVGYVSLYWKLLTINKQWSSVLIDRYFRNKKPIIHHISSSIWHDINHSFSSLEEHSRWWFGNGKKIVLRVNNWLKYKIKDLHLVLPMDIQLMKTSQSNSIIQDINLTFLMPYPFASSNY